MLVVIVKFTMGFIVINIELDYLVETIGPSLLDPLLGPKVVGVLGQLVNQLFHFGRKGNRAKVKGCRFVAVGLHEGLVREPYGLYTRRWFVYRYVVTQGENGPEKR
jgi:hypothetical protein